MESIAILDDGSIRKLFDPSDVSELGAYPKRASQVEGIETGAQRGRFYVDFSRLGPEYRYCLVETFASHEQAVAAERDWLRANWIEGSLESAP